MGFRLDFIVNELFRAYDFYDNEMYNHPKCTFKGIYFIFPEIEFIFKDKIGKLIDISCKIINKETSCRKLNYRYKISYDDKCFERDGNFIETNFTEDYEEFILALKNFGRYEILTENEFNLSNKFKPIIHNKDFKVLHQLEIKNFNNTNNIVIRTVFLYKGKIGDISDIIDNNLLKKVIIKFNSKEFIYDLETSIINSDFTSMDKDFINIINKFLLHKKYHIKTREEIYKNTL